jgi:CBS domain-containing protein
MIFTLELTQDLNLLPGLLVGCIAAHGVTVLLLRRSILTEKVARRGYHIMREYSVDPLAIVRVGEVMDRNAPIIPADMSVTELSNRIAQRDPQMIRHEALLLVDDNQRLVGIITRGDVLRALEQGSDNRTTVLDAGSQNPVVSFPDEVLHEATVKMLRNNIGRLPVVSRGDSHRILGYLGRSNLMEAHSRQLEEEHNRERRFPQRASAKSNIQA